MVRKELIELVLNEESRYKRKDNGIFVSAVPVCLPRLVDFKMSPYSHYIQAIKEGRPKRILELAEGKPNETALVLELITLDREGQFVEMLSGKAYYAFFDCSVHKYIDKSEFLDTIFKNAPPNTSAFRRGEIKKFEEDFLEQEVHYYEISRSEQDER